MKNLNYLLLFMSTITSCWQQKESYDATGTFESEEILVSSEIPGKIIQLTLNEGDTIGAGKVAAIMDTVQLQLQIEQLQSSIQALYGKTLNVMPQIKLIKDQLEVQKIQLSSLQKEKTRFENLVKSDAATKKQLDDINSQMDVLKQQMNVSQQQLKVQSNTTGTQNRSILSEQEPLERRIAVLRDQIKRATIHNPVNGTILTIYAKESEVVLPGKPIYKIADLKNMTLRAYVSGNQLSSIKLGQELSIFTDNGGKKMKEYKGIITWISDKAEFTPKTIHTKEERVNLVYAIKVSVENDGYLKLGMYGEIRLNKQ